jgi:cell division protein FtsL
MRHSLKKRIVSSKSLIPALFVTSLILLACLHVWQRVYVMGLVKEVSTLKTENGRLKDLVKKANMEVIELSRLSRIEKIAGEKLGLSKSDTENLFTLSLGDRGFQPEGLEEVVTSLKKIADNLPVLNESRAETDGVFDSNGD